MLCQQNLPIDKWCKLACVCSYINLNHVAVECCSLGIVYVPELMCCIALIAIHWYCPQQRGLTVPNHPPPDQVCVHKQLAQPKEHVAQSRDVICL